MATVYRLNLLKTWAWKWLRPLSPIEIVGSEMCKSLREILVWRARSPLEARTRTATCLIPKCQRITTTSPERAAGALCRMWGVLCHVVLCRSSGTHRGMSAAHLTGQPVPVGLTHFPSSPAHKRGALGMLIFCFGHRKAFQQNSHHCSRARRKESRKAFLPSCSWARWWCPLLWKLSVCCAHSACGNLSP